MIVTDYDFQVGRRNHSAKKKKMMNWTPSKSKTSLH